MDIKEKINSIPNAPGVYFFKDEAGSIIYIGKAANLKHRIQSHFAARDASLKSGSMIEQICGIDYIITASEEEALLYEAHLIKKYKPKFNVVFRDDKTYPLLKLTMAEEYPRLFITRGKKDDGALYFGPFTNAKLLKRALALMRKIFPLRTCNKMPSGACLNYHLKQCLAPCINKGNKEAYQKAVEDIVMFLEGNRKQLITNLNQRMAQYSSSREFEKALLAREQIKALLSLTTPEQEKDEALEELQELLGLENPPRRIEAFDISNYAGKEAVGSMVTFIEGRPYKMNYRRFKIKFAAGIDDYGMMREVIKRRFERLMEEGQPKPDMALIDGGRGHFSVVTGELKKMGLSDIRVAAIAKEEENLYISADGEPIELFKFPKALFLIQRIRDEAHRFAISYHHKLRFLSVRTSVLDQIPGVGEKRKIILLNAFGSVSKIRRATIEELDKLPTIDEKLAQRIIEYLRK